MYKYLFYREEWLQTLGMNQYHTEPAFGLDALDSLLAVLVLFELSFLAAQFDTAESEKKWGR
jgi:hypothetical protein